jgi:galactokinase
MVAAPRDDGIVSVVDARWHDAVEIDPGDDERPYRGWTNYAAVVSRRLARNFPGAPLGATIVMISDLPRAAGLSSSSALVVGLSLVLIERGGLETRPEWQAAIRTRLDLAGYLGAVENGLSFPGLAGSSGVGTHGGSEDHTAILTGRPNQVLAYSYLPVQHLGDAALPDDWCFAVMGSGVRADKAGSVRGPYNRASLATRALGSVWRLRVGGEAATLGEAVLDQPDAVAALERAVAAGDGHDGFDREALTRRLAHFVAENSRVSAAVRAFLSADAPAIGELAAASQRDADVLLDNQVPETRALAAAALESGAFAASSFGAGFGGSVWALVRSAEADDAAARWQAAYARQVPDAGETEAFVTRPGPAALRVFPTE